MSSSPCPKVVVIDSGYDSYEVEAAIVRQAGGSLEISPCDGDAIKVEQVARGAAGLLVRESPVTRVALLGMKPGGAVVRYGVGVDNIDLATATDRRIYVANVPDYGVDEVSDHALALLLAVTRRIVSRDQAVRLGAWNVARKEAMHRLRGRTLGLIGFGRIAQAFLRKARELGFARTLVVDPNLEQSPAGITLVDLSTLCAEADVISLHAPLLESTRHVIDRATLARMKPTSIIINTSRGGLIDEAALAEALHEGRLFGAGLDVFEKEPPAQESPLFQAPNMVMSDHTAWYSEEAVADLQRKAAEEVARVLAGGEPLHWINRWPNVQSAQGAGN